MVKNIFYIHRFPFNREAYIRDEFDFLLSEGYNVKYLDISHLLKKKQFVTNYREDLKQHILYFSTQKEFNSFIGEKKDRSVIITDVGLLANSAWMYLPIFKNRIPYILFENSVLPKIKSTTKSEVASSGLKRVSLAKVLNKPTQLGQLFLAKRTINYPNLIISSKPKLSSEKRSLCSKLTTIKKVASLDYFAAEETVLNSLIDEPYVVFIDQYFVHHPDFKSNHIIDSFTAEQYYTELNNYLIAYENNNKIKVIVACHPRRSKEQESDFDKRFSLVYNQTANLVKFADLVLVHFSTAINYAVIFNKPFILLSSNLFTGGNIIPKIQMFATYFEKECINISDITSDMKIATNINTHVDTNTYKKYYEMFVNPQNSVNKTFRKLITEELAKL